jgi:ABC-type amino acid transport substrate-binding protein
MDWKDMEEALFAANGTCDVAATGLPVTGEYLGKGIVFSWPTYENGLIIAVNNEQAGASIWAFTDAFAWQVWVALIATSLVVGVIIFGVDAWMYGAKYDKTAHKFYAGTNLESEGKYAFSDYVWDALLRPTQVRDQRPLSFASNFIVLAFAFMMLVVVTVYTANTTANITTTRLQSAIRGLQDLPGKKVGTWSQYRPELSKYGVIPIPFPWENDADEAAMINSLTNGTIQALVLDESFLVYKASLSCEIAVIGQKFEELNQAVAFPRGFNDTALLGAVNQALVELKEDGTISLLRDTYVDPPEASCKTSLVGDAAAKITLEQLAGLWVMLGVGIGIALFIAVVYKLHVRYAHQHVVKLSSTITRKITKSFSLDRRNTAMDVHAAHSAVLATMKEEDSLSNMC